MKHFLPWFYFVFVKGISLFEAALKLNCPSIDDKYATLVHQELFHSCIDNADKGLKFHFIIADLTKKDNSPNCIQFVEQIMSIFYHFKGLDPENSSKMIKAIVRIFLTTRSYQTELSILNCLQELFLVLEYRTTNENFRCKDRHEIVFAIFEGVLNYASTISRIPLKIYKRIKEVEYLVILRCKIDFGKDIDDFISPVIHEKLDKSSNLPESIETNNAIILESWKNYSKILALKRGPPFYDQRLAPQQNLSNLVDLLKGAREIKEKLGLFDLLEPCYLCDFLNSLSYLHYKDDKMMRRDIFELKKLIFVLLTQLGTFEKHFPFQ